jgi:hypothetical protein
MSPPASTPLGGSAPASPSPEPVAPVATPSNTVETPSSPVAAPAAPSPAPEADWRARFAGEDTKALETLARFKTEGDFFKTFQEQQKTLSKRAEPTRLPENAKPEQIAEFRKSYGLPELGGDAKPEAFMEAYKIAIPQGYEASNVEKGLLGDFAKLAYEKGMDPAAVKASTDFFLQQQVANQQALNKINEERQGEWRKSLQAELGKDYQPLIDAGDAYLNQLFAETPQVKDELLNATLPGGGKLHSHPAFIKMVTEQALAAGFTDRIETTSMESGGKSLAEQQQEIEGMMFKDPAKYNLPATQQKLNKIIELRLKGGEIDDSGEPVRKRRSA